MRIMLAYNDYHSCIEKAFLNHLLDPSNNQNLYYLLEGIRRACYINKKVKTQKFLSWSNAYLKKGPGVLADLKDYISDSLLYSQIRAKDLLDTTRIEFNSYNDAFGYFYGIADKRNLTEAYLTKALYLGGIRKSALRDSLLKKYIAAGDGKYTDFAEKLLRRELFDGENNRELLLVDDIHFIEDHTYGFYDRLLLGEEKQVPFVDGLRAMCEKKFPNKEVLFISDILKNNTPQTMMLRQLVGTSEFLAVESDPKTPLFLYVLDPGFFGYLSKNDIKTVEYLRLMGFEDKTYYSQNLLSLINPVRPFLGGSAHYGYYAFYYSLKLSDRSQTIFAKSTIVNYRMDIGNMQNTVFHLFKDREAWERKTFPDELKKKKKQQEKDEKKLAKKD